jgi:hypothetical protein
MSQRRRSATDLGVAGKMTGTAGERFARALAAKDSAACRALLADPIDFQALTPGTHWQASAHREVVDDIIFGKWFDADDHIEALESVSGTRLPGGREHVRYQLLVHNSDGKHLVEQQAYYNTDGERITWMRVLCSGYQKLPG